MSTTKRIFLFSALVLCVLFHITNATSSTTSTTSTPAFPKSVITQMASRQMRYHHYLWHQVRDNWNRFSSATQAAFTKLGWKPSNPARDSNGNSITTNLCGEDFLYMHRDMLARANQIISDNKDPYGKIVGWTTLPAPGDKTYPVPPAYQKGSDPQSLASYKTDAFYTKSIKALEDSLKDPKQLAKLTLSQLGNRIESGIHNNMHNRWSNFSVLGYRGGAQSYTSASVINVSKTWDDPRYDWLVDTYSSHVNPIFWKLHGWIDDRVTDWMKAHNLTSIKWNGTWIGGPMSSLSSVMKESGNMTMTMNSEENSDSVGDVLEEVMVLLQSSGAAEWNPSTTTLEEAQAAAEIPDEMTAEGLAIANSNGSTDTTAALGAGFLVKSTVGLVLMVALLL